MKSRGLNPRLLACLAAWLALLALMIGLLAISDPATAQQYIHVGGSIIHDTTWPAGIYIVDDDLSIDGGSLTIDPGAEVRFRPGTELRVVGGPLLALGEPGNPITFTADSPEPVRDFWEGLVYEGTAPPSELRHCIIEYAATGLATDVTQSHLVDGCTLRHNGDGGDWETGGAIDAAGDALSLTNNLIYDNEVGLHLRKSFNNVITGNQISGNDGYGIAFVADDAPAGGGNLIANNEIHHNGGFGLGILGAPPSNDGSNNVIRDNLVYEHTAAQGYPGHGIYLRLGSNNSVRGNRIWGNAGHGLRFDEQTALDVVHNTVRDNELDGLAYGATNATPAALHGNVLCRNARYQLVSAWPSLLPAEGNWFGTNAPTSGSEIVGNVHFTPWISLAVAIEPPVLPATPCPMVIPSP
ncbi:MAG: right-handed parallel beta-helix repeat-containing protein [Anaerolineae bacterium]